MANSLLLLLSIRTANLVMYCMYKWHNKHNLSSSLTYNNECKDKLVDISLQIIQNCRLI